MPRQLAELLERGGGVRRLRRYAAHDWRRSASPPRRCESSACGATQGVVRKGCLYYPILFRIWFAKPCKTAKFFNPLNVFPMSPVNVTAPFLVQKALKTANSEKCVFLCPASKVQPGPPNSLVFRRKPAPGVPKNTVINDVTASSPLSLGPKSAQKAWKSKAGSAASV